MHKPNNNLEDSSRGYRYSLERTRVELYIHKFYCVHFLTTLRRSSLMHRSNLLRQYYLYIVHEYY